ncbi:MAG: D-alanine--D-alanine ligase [Actinomycetota bacterium]|nr:D-alanine--D-alanine ligase [Actinomycetota bacterium]
MVVRVLHLTGSPLSAFHDDLSRLYAADCLRATLDPTRYDHVVAHVAPDGRWRFPTGLGDAALAAAPALTLARAVEHLTGLEVDVMLPQMFCLPGMTTYRGLFDLLGVPYVGNPPDVMALGAHKARARAVVDAAGVLVPPGEVLLRGQRATLEPPVVVKPVDADNSHGVSLVTTGSDYEQALVAAFGHADEVLVERFVPLGREVRCGVLERAGQLTCLPLEEYAVNAQTKPIRDAADKLRRADEGDLHLVAKDAEHAWIVDPDDPVTRAVWQAATACHRALGCRDYSLFDFRVDPEGRVWFLEASLYWSFAPTSVLSVMAGAAGISLLDGFDEAVRSAMARLPA